MIQSKVLPAILLIFGTALCYQVYVLTAIPKVEDELFRNEASYYKRINLQSKQYLAEVYHNVTSLAGMKNEAQCLKQVEGNSELFRSSNRVLSNAIQAINNGENPKELLATEFERQAQMVQKVRSSTSQKLYFSDYNFDEVNANVLSALDVVRAESAMLKNYIVAAGFISQECVGIYCDFASLEGMVGRRIGKAAIHDTLTVMSTNPMQLDVTERIQISFSRKFIVKMIDSLKSAGKVQVDAVPEYSAVVKILSEQLDVKPFDPERQFVSASDYTTWEYDIVGTKAGLAEIEIELGIVTSDFENKETIVNVILPLDAVTVKD